MNTAPWVEMFGLLAPYGKCQCGCGRDAPIAKVSRSERGDLRGEPIRYIRGHVGAVINNAWTSLEEICAAYVIPGQANDCWPWKGFIARNGYGYVSFHRKDMLGHRVSYIVNRGPIPEGMHVCHRCDNPACVNPNHLFLGTHQDNMDDKVRKGRQPRGERNGGVKLSDAQVARIKVELAERTESNNKIARRYGVGRKAIDFIESGRNWAHIPGPPPTRKNPRNLPTGSKHHNAKLSDADVIEIRRLLAEGTQTQRAIALHYGVSETLISAIKLGRARQLETELKHAANGKVPA